MRSTATGRSGGIAVFIGDSVTDKSPDGAWIGDRLCPLPHIPFNTAVKPLNGKYSGYGFHSPDGFNIGYEGSGCADLALAICHLFKKPNLYQAFKKKVIAALNATDKAGNFKEYDLSFDSIELTLAMVERGQL